jgi:restriction endonuclease S subunit
MYPTKKLSEICKIIGWWTPSKSNPQYYIGDILWASVRDMKDEFLEDTELKISEEAVKESSTHIIPAWNVIIATRVWLWKVCLNKFPTAINQDLKWILPRNNNSIGINYLFWWFKSISRKLENAWTGATVKWVRMDFIESLEIPLPPLPTQSRIVAKLDEAFGNIDKHIKLLKENIEDVENIKKSVLEESFKSEEYEIRKLWEIFDVRDGTHDSPKFYTEGFPLVTSKNLWDDSIDLQNVKLVSSEDYEKINQRSKVDKGDLLFAMIGTIGSPTIVDFEPNFAIKNVALFKKKSSEISMYYLRYFLLSDFVIRKMLTEAKWATQKFVWLGYLRQFFIPLPPLSRQNEIVAHLDVVFDKSRVLKSEYETQIRDLEMLKQSLLEEAFTGRLVQENEA